MADRIPTFRRKEVGGEIRPSSSKRGYGGSWPAKRRAQLRRQPVCEYCGQRFATQVDHVQPLTAGGADDPTNYRSCCASCHSRKTVLHDGGLGRPKSPLVLPERQGE